MSPLVAVIVPTWNRREEVLACVSGLLALDYDDRIVVVVDNGSVDGTSEALAETFGDSIVVLRNETNLGYAGGNNVAIRWALQRGAEYVCLVNNDAEAGPGLLRELVEVARGDPSIGAVGCRNLALDDPTRLWGAYGELTYGPFVVRTAGQGAPDAETWRVTRDVDWVIGNGSLWSCAAISEVGLLDEDFFAYHDDVDWCVRLREHGYRVVYAGHVSILHRGGGTSDVRREHVFPQAYFLARNGVLFVRKHASAAQALRFCFWCGAAMLGRWVRAALSRLPGFPERDRQGNRFWEWEASYARGIVDGLRGRRGVDSRMARGCR